MLLHLKCDMGFLDFHLIYMCFEFLLQYILGDLISWVARECPKFVTLVLFYHEPEEIE